MAKRYTLGGKPIHFSTDNTLGTGGQAVVVLINDAGADWAVKWWKSPQRNQILKVEYLLKNPPRLPTDKFLFPIKPFRNEMSEMEGYGMSPLPRNFREGGVLFNKTLRKNLNINTPTMLAIMDSHRSDIEALHDAGIVLGDESGRNFAFVLSSAGAKTFCYDTDAYQVAGYPCPVWTEFFLCPDLYQYTSTKQNVPFTEATDWYGFATILFWSLFNTNPYQQSHSKYDQFRDKAQRGLWLLDSSVDYPRPLCPHPETVSDHLLGYFEQIFKKHKFSPLSHSEIVDYANSLIECSSCLSYYPNNRPACPNCSIKTPAIDFSPDHKFEKLISTRGPIVFARFQSGNLYVISREKTGYFLHVRPGKGQTISGLVPLDINENYRFDLVGSDHLLVNPRDEESLYICPISNLGDWLTTSTVTYLGNRQAVYKGTDKGLYRVAGNQVLLGEIKNGFLVEETKPIQLTAGQSWLWSEASGERLVTMSRYFSMVQFELVKGKYRYDLPVPQLEDTDTLTDITVKFGGDSICVRRMVNRKGRSMILTEVFDDYGTSLFSSTHLVTKLPGQDIHKTAFEDGKIYWPTDSGLMVENLRSNVFEVVRNTEKLISSDDRLIHLASGTHFLVIKENKVNYLVL